MGLECLRCHAVFDDPRGFAGCPRCRQDGVFVNLSVRLDLTPLAGLRPDQLPATPRGLWRFGAVLPAAGHAVSLGEGATPLVHLERLGRRLGLPRLYARTRAATRRGRTRTGSARSR